MSFKYERLRNFCQNCGLLTHENQECPLGFDDDQLPSDPDDDDDEGGDDGNGPGPTEVDLHNKTGALNDHSGPSKDNVTDEESMPIVSDVTLGNNKRKRDQGLSGDEEKSDGLAVPEVDDEMFWKYAPLSVVTAEYERRMGAERT